MHLRFPLIFLLSLLDPLTSEFTSSLHILSPLSSRPMELRDGQEVVFTRRRPFSLLSSGTSWSVCYYTQPNGTVCRLLHFDYDIPGCPQISREEGGNPGCRFDILSPSQGNWTNSLFVFNETAGDFDVKSIGLRALVKSRLSTSKKRIRLFLDESVEVYCDAERGYPASSIVWQHGYSPLQPSSPSIINCDDFSCSTRSLLNFTARRVGKTSLLCISSQKDTLGNLIKTTMSVGVTVLPLSQGPSFIFLWTLIPIIILLFIIFFLICFFLLFSRRKRRKPSLSASNPEISPPFTIYNPPPASLSSSSAYFSSDELHSPREHPSKGEDTLFKFEWEGHGPGSESGSLSDIVDTSSSSGSDFEDSSHREPICQSLDKSTQAIYGALPNESWV